MNKRTRQYIGILAALGAYYIIHEGAHLIYALCIGAFEQVNFMGLGIQIDANTASMSDAQIGIFCLVGVVATLLCGYIMAALSGTICNAKSKPFKAVMYYITIALLLLDPLYLSALCGLVGGGDMNGIALLMSETMARIGFGIILLINGFIFWKAVLPRYTASFKQ